MNILLGTEGSLSEFGRLIKELESDEYTRGIMLLACDSNGFTPEQLDPLLKSASVPVFGGIFPDLIFENRVLGRGAIAVGFEEAPIISVIPDLSRADPDYESLITADIPFHSKDQTMFLFVDGLADSISALVEAVFDTLGHNSNYIGGGTGSLSFKRKPGIITNRGLIGDAAVMAATNIISGIGVKHGWEAVHSSLTVTEAKKNTILSLNWKPAFEVYSKIVEEYSGETFTDGDFFRLAKDFPFGIQKFSSENVVRDPVKRTRKGGIVCVGEVPVNSVVTILHGTTRFLLSAAMEALENAKEHYRETGENIGSIFFIGSISRALYLKEEFQKELDAVHEEGFPMFGVLSLGELANSGRDYLEFYNKTAVVGVLNQ